MGVCPLSKCPLSEISLRNSTGIQSAFKDGGGNIADLLGERVLLIVVGRYPAQPPAGDKVLLGDTGAAQDWDSAGERPNGVILVALEDLATKGVLYCKV